MQKGEVCTADASCCSFSQRGSHFGSGHYFYEQLSAAFFGALDDEELFIIEGSCQLVRSVVWTDTLLRLKQQQ